MTSIRTQIDSVKRQNFMSASRINRLTNQRSKTGFPFWTLLGDYKSGHPIPGHPDLPVETAAEIKLLARGEPVPLDLLVRSNLVQQELTRLGINSMALLNRTVNVAPDVMGKAP